MRQVPKILIIGDGALAANWSHYLKLLKLEHQQWCRKQDLSNLNNKISSSDLIFLAVKDDAIESFYFDFLTNNQKICFHFSGVHYFDSIWGIHPLQSFHSDYFYDLKTYQSTPLLADHNLTKTKSSLWFLDNPFYSIKAEQKSLYHALCVLSGNFPQMIWKDCEEILLQLNLPKKILQPYLEQCLSNFFEQKKYLSGPICRGDKKTIEKNIDSLKELSNKQSTIYQFFNKKYNGSRRSEY